MYTSSLIRSCDVGWHAPRRHETRLGAAPLLAHCRVPSSFACGGSLPSQLESELVFACCCPVSRPWTSLGCPPAGGTADKFAVASSALRRTRGVEGAYDGGIWPLPFAKNLIWGFGGPAFCQPPKTSKKQACPNPSKSHKLNLGTPNSIILIFV